MSVHQSPEDIINASGYGYDQEGHALAITSYFANRESFKENKAPAGASLLKDKEGKRILKAVAPMAHQDCETKGDFPITSDNELAAVATEPTNALAATTPDNPAADSLCSSTTEEKNDKADTDPDDDADLALLMDDSADDEVLLYDPDFYKVRVDFFDNGVQQNKTQYTAKLSIMAFPTTTKENEYVCFANFYSRARDFRAKVKACGFWGDWYVEVEDVFQSVKDTKANFDIPPQIAILKVPERDAYGKTKFRPVGYTACILQKRAGEPVEVLVMYQDFLNKVVLDKPFQKTKLSNLVAMGVYRDEERAHLEPKQSQANTMVIHGPDFFK